jgi:hypothetical protein
MELLSYRIEPRWIVLRRIVLSLFLPGIAFSVFCPSAAGQGMPCDDQQQLRQRSAYDSRPHDAAAPGPDIPPDMQRKQMKELNQERHATLKKDTDKLLQAATELKQQVDKTNENQLSLEVIRKTEEVEKLAKAIREKMKSGGYCDLVVGQ